MRKKLFYLLVIIILALSAFVYRVKIKSFFYDFKKPDLPEAVNFIPEAGNQNNAPDASPVIDSSTPNHQDGEQDQELPESFNLNVPFTSQAPTGNWSEPWQNACEEASFLIVDYYYQNKTFPAPAAVEQILADMVDWQITNWGDHHDLPIAELAKYIEQNFAYDTEVLTNLTPDILREHLQKGQPIIVPADGRVLDNPYFRGEGPEYHMLVVKGYVNNDFITNDPGTRRGADYVYTSQNLFDSIADFVPGQGTVGPDIGLVIHPKK